MIGGDLLLRGNCGVLKRFWMVCSIKNNDELPTCWLFVG